MRMFLLAGSLPSSARQEAFLRIPSLLRAQSIELDGHEDALDSGLAMLGALDAQAPLARLDHPLVGTAPGSPVRVDAAPLA